MIFFLELKLHKREAFISGNLIFVQFASVKSFKIFTMCEICPADHSKAEKMRVTKAVSSLFANVCRFPLSHIWSYENYQIPGTRWGTNRLNAPPNLGKFHRRKDN